MCRRKIRIIQFLIKNIKVIKKNNNWMCQRDCAWRKISTKLIQSKWTIKQYKKTDETFNTKGNFSSYYDWTYFITLPTLNLVISIICTSHCVQCNFHLSRTFLCISKLGISVEKLYLYKMSLCRKDFRYSNDFKYNCFKNY